MQVLESLFVIFIIYPYTKNILDAVKKEPKVYFYDIGQVDAEEGFKIESFVALHLLKRNQFLEDTQGKKKREVDFAIEENNQLTHLIKVKKAADQFNVSLNYFSLRLKTKNAIQLVLNLKHEKDFKTHQIRHLGNFLLSLETE